jgi:Zn-dependent M28 family amino/carboxypeptidase
VLATVLTTAAIAGLSPAPDAGDAHALARSLALAGPRPAASAAERAAHARVEERFRAAGLRIGHDRFRVPGRGASQNVLGIRDGRSDCLRVLMAHTDSVPPAPGADDNASGVGALVALAAAVGAGPRPPCDTWFVATGAEERPYTRQPDHLGALALARRLRSYGRARDVRFGLSLDEVGRGRAFWLRSPAGAPRAGVERSLLAAARRTGVSVRWVRDGSDSNSDHRELERAGMPAMKLGVPDDPLRHTAGDTADRLQRAAFERILRVVAQLLD